MTVSLVIPAYRERGRIGATLAHVVEYLSAQPYDWEVLVVIDDGDDDETATEARAAAGGSPQVRVLVNDANRGKGFSVRRGFAEAHGDLKVFIDADLSLPVEALAAMCERFAAGADVVIASRSVPGAREIGAPPPSSDTSSPTEQVKYTSGIVSKSATQKTLQTIPPYIVLLYIMKVF